jgi:hypothetical protein
MGIFGIYGKNGIYFMVLVLFLMVDVFGVQMCIAQNVELVD